MPIFTHQGVTLAYDDVRPEGASRRTAVLIHGYAANRHATWTRNGWPQALAARGFRAIVLDQRGHGESSKPYDADSYDRRLLGDDVNALLDHLEIDRADLIGHSMGGRVAVEAALVRPERATSLVLTALGANLLNPRSDALREAMVQAMLAPDQQSVADLALRAFRRYAENQGEDLRAMAAFTGGDRLALEPARLADLVQPVLVAIGERDRMGEPAALSRYFPHAQARVIAGANHFSVLQTQALKDLVFDFLDGVTAPA